VALVLLAPAQAAVFDIAPGDVTALIAAINAANGNGEENTINLAAGTYTLTAVDNDTDGPNGLPSITSALPLTLRGVGAESTIIERGSSAPSFRLLHVAASGTLLLEGLTLRGGAGGNASGILNRGTLTLTHSTVANNMGGRVFVPPFFESFLPGGIINSGTATLTHSTVANNTGGNGAGISNGGTLTLTHSTVVNNSCLPTEVPCSGGGIDNFPFPVGTLTIINSTVANNGGGGIGTGGTLSLTNSTVAHNFGVGIAPRFPGGTVALQNTILARNTRKNCVGAVTSLGNNLLDDLTGCTITMLPSDLLGDPGLGAFTDAGSPGTGHVPLLPTSPAIDAGNNAVCLATDQRGQPRPVDGNGDGIATCDIGAFEFFPLVNDLVELAADMDTTSDSTPVPGGPAGTFTITATFTNQSPTPLHFLFFGVSELSGGNLLLNADAGPGGVGATLTPEVAGEVLAPGAAVTVEFVIGLQTRQRFTFFVNVFGEPLL
jgi:hypothetical protein